MCALIVTFALGLLALNYLVQRLVIAALLLLTLAACDGRGFPKDYRLPAYQGVDYWRVGARGL